mmetsp:Transcript_916/g.1926  ORF Transcript_916/g.1926 Transcript_916/m.1926 type:complete len:109 (+) Transcript_916:223-549(+)
MGDGKLVILSCDIDKENTLPLTGFGAFESQSHVGTGLRYDTRMWQCVEHKYEKEVVEDHGWYQYSHPATFFWYSIELVDHPVDSSKFDKVHEASWRTNCSFHNPRWPS